ncbi:hypothetical protein ES332_A12G161800v1 [Gossypium tomentosum]|uniref:Uncharacterized protein n=1 Tax=Gossypium tomentosum TaxID=34277 RepID=A0A5D2MXX9_GOSTO|nr:hypothetical protein ES332_A12G161800v1 [Gossypium tomentosum]
MDPSACGSEKQMSTRSTPNQQFAGTGYEASCGVRLVDAEAWLWLWHKEAVRR